MLRKRSIATICGGILFLTLVVMLVAMGYVRQLEAMLRGENYSFLQEISEQGAKTVDRQLESDLKVLQGMAAVLGGDEELDVAGLVETLGSNAMFEKYQRIGVILPDGSGYGQDVSGVDFSDRQYFREAMAGRSYVSDVMVDRVTGLFSYTYAVPIQREGQVTAVLAAVTNMEVLQELLFDKPFLGEGYSYLVKQDGQVVLRSKNSLELDNLFAEMVLPAGEREALAARMAARETGNLEFSLRGEAYFLSYVPLAMGNRYLATVLPAGAVEARGQEIMRLTAFSVATVCCVLLLILSGFFVLQARSREKLFRLAYFDPLTGLYNKHYFRQKAAARLEEGRWRYVYCILNLKRFQTVNERFGYPEGDQLLRHVARVLEREMGEGELAARFSADVFHLLLRAEGTEALEGRLWQLAEEIDGYVFPGEKVDSLYVGFGVYEIEGKALSVDTIGDMARLALNCRQEELSTTVSFFSEPLQNRLVEEREIEETMRWALRDGQFRIYLQPQYGLSNRELVGAEALVRWVHPKKGMIPPDRFIPLFEKNGFISELDLEIFRGVCAAARRWQEAGAKPLPISVNQSRVNLWAGYYLERLIGIFQAQEISADWIKMEITESAFVDDVEALGEIVDRLHDEGFRVSIDDFGSGYSTLNMLQDIVVEELKLDKKFLKESANSHRGRKIVESVITMAKGLGMEVVAEGVETAEQAAFLKGVDCDVAQGYLFARPMPLEVFETEAGLKYMGE